MPATSAGMTAEIDANYVGNALALPPFWNGCCAGGWPVYRAAASGIIGPQQHRPRTGRKVWSTRLVEKTG